jgi:hypothetical protein
MVRVSPRQISMARAVVAVLFAWLLALQNFAAAASSHRLLAQTAAGQTHFQISENCGAPRGENPSAPCRHDHCECCILCTSTHGSGGLAALAPILSSLAILPLQRVKTASVWHLSGADSKRPSGWTSSWSQRAPPRFS